MHELHEPESAVGSAGTLCLGVGCHAVGCDAGVPYGERHGLSLVYTQFHRGGVVGQQGYGYLLACAGHLVEYRADHASIEIFDGFDFEVYVAVVAGLVGSLYVQKHKVIAAQ